MHLHAGDLLAIFPRVPQAAVEQLLTRLQLPGDAWVRITPRSRAADNGASDDGAETSVETTDAGGLAVVAPLQAVLQVGAASATQRQPTKENEPPQLHAWRGRRTSCCACLDHALQPP